MQVHETAFIVELESGLYTFQMEKTETALEWAGRIDHEVGTKNACHRFHLLHDPVLIEKSAGYHQLSPCLLTNLVPGCGLSHGSCGGGHRQRETTPKDYPQAFHNRVSAARPRAPTHSLPPSPQAPCFRLCTFPPSSWCITTVAAHGDPSVALDELFAQAMAETNDTEPFRTRRREAAQQHSTVLAAPRPDLFGVFPRQWPLAVEMLQLRLADARVGVGFYCLCTGSLMQGKNPRPFRATT
jgi:hypothetical protein